MDFLFSVKKVISMSCKPIVKGKMVSKNTPEERTRIFDILCAGDPRSWASSEINEDFTQLARYLFLKHAWRKIVSEEDTSWIEKKIECANRNPGYLTTGLGLARS